MAKRKCLWGALCLLSAACAPVGRGKFDSQGYLNSNYLYRVTPSPSTGQILSNSWWLDNYYQEGTKIVPKTNEMYKTEFRLDANGDGAVDVRQSALLYDLRFKHRQRDAVIILRTFPIEPGLRDREPRVLMQDLVDSVAGAGYEAATPRPGADPNLVRVEEKRFAASIVERGEARVAGMPAYWATVDIANIDQLKLSPDARRVRLQVVLAKTPFRFQPAAAGPGGPEFPVIMLAEYATLPEDFAKDLPDFNDMLGRVTVGGAAGYVAEPPTAPATPATAPSSVPHAAAPSAAPAPAVSVTPPAN